MLCCQAMKSRVDILGTLVDPVDIAETVARIEAMIAAGNGGAVCATNVHTVMEGHYHPAYRAAVNDADLSVPDGMPIVWASSLLGTPLRERVYGPDLLLAVCADPRLRQRRHFFYGATAKTLVRLRSALTARFPHLIVAGMEAPPFRPLTPEEDARAVATINGSGAEILWVGLGAPKQERWMAEHREKLRAVQVGVGAAFDFLSGVKRQAPVWMRRRGLEWLFRLGMEPRRLWRRYLIYNPLFILKFWRRLRASRIGRETPPPSGRGAV